MPPPNMVYEAFILSQVQFSVGDTVMIKVGEAVKVLVMVWWVHMV